MRLALIIVALGAIAVALVHIRRAEMAVRYDIQRLQARQVRLRRRIWDQQVTIGRLTGPEELRRRAIAMGEWEGGFAPPQVAFGEGE